MSFCKLTQNSQGQSLVEFILILPLFFIICTGLIFYFHIQFRNVIDDFASSALSKSSSLFSTEERQEAKWSQEFLNSEKLLLNTTDTLFSASKEFKSKNMKEGMFIEAKRLQSQKKSCEAKQPSYFMEQKDSQNFELFTCADEMGYDRFATDEISPHILKKQTIHHFKIHSLYVPQGDFEWNMRHNMVFLQIDSYLNTLAGIGFKREVASLNYPTDHGRFNTLCYMSPFLSECPIIFVSGKFERAASDGANAQIAACVLEALTTCPPAADGVTSAACVAYRISSITVSLLEGKASGLCPELNRVAAAGFSISELKSKELSLLNRAQELKLR